MDRDDVIEEMREVEKDRLAFVSARDSIQRRVNDMDGARQQTFIHWAGTQAIMNVLIMCVVRCEGLIKDYQALLEQNDAPDNVRELRRVK